MIASLLMVQEQNLPDWNKTHVNSIADISGPDGIPDKNVNYWDLNAFTGDYLKDINEPGTW
jgi:hypothetical protein